MKYICFFLCSLMLTSCASYRAVEMDTSRPARNRIKKKDIKGMAIAAEDYSSSKKSTKFFNRELRDYGYLPIYVCVDNSADYEFTVKLKDIKFFYEDGSEASLVKVDEVIEAVQSSPGWALLTFPLIFPVFFIWSSVSEANYQLDEDYTKKSLRDFHLVKDDQLFGFVYVKIPEGKEETSITDGILKIPVLQKAKGQEEASNEEVIVSISKD